MPSRPHRKGAAYNHYEDQAASSSNYDSNSMDDCEMIEDNFSDEEIEETPSQSAVPSSLRLHPYKILIPQRKNQDHVPNFDGWF